MTASLPFEDPIEEFDETEVKVPGRWTNVILLSFAGLVDGVEGGILGILFTVMRPALGLATSALGFIAALGKLVGAIFGPIWGMVGDRYDRKSILVFATGVWGIWTVALGMVQNYTQVLILVAISAAGASATTPVTNSVLSDLFTDKTRGWAKGVWAGITGILGIIAIVMVGQLSEIENGWRIGYYVAGGLSIFSGVLIYFFYKDPVRGQTDEGMGNIAEQAAEAHSFSFDKVSQLFRIPSLGLMLADKFLIGTVTLFTFLPTFLEDFRGIPVIDGTLVVGALAGGLGLGRFVAGAVSGMIGSHRINARSVIYHVALTLSFIFLIISLAIDFGTDIGPYALVNFLLGFVLAFDNPIMHPMIARITTPEMRSTAYGLWQSGSERLGDVLFTFLVGVLTISMGLDVVLLYLVSGLVLIRIMIWFLIYRTYAADVDQNDHVLAERRAELS
ncbi:MAG: MFS transporter [Chloroflexota bacterium]